MAGSLAYDATHADQAGTRVAPIGDPRVSRAEGLWTLFGLVIFGALLTFTVGP